MDFKRLREENKLAKKRSTVFMCQECGYESAKYLGKCPSCGKWNTFVEEKLHKKQIQEAVFPCQKKSRKHKQ